MADPFVWKHNGQYFAVGTGPAEAHGEVKDAEEASSAMLGRFRIFPLLQSDDFVTWRHTLGALVPPDPVLGDTFWAPEVAHHDDTFYLYYSAGHGDKITNCGSRLRTIRSAPTTTRARRWSIRARFRSRSTRTRSKTTTDSGISSTRATSSISMARRAPELPWSLTG